MRLHRYLLAAALSTFAFAAPAQSAPSTSATLVAKTGHGAAVDLARDKGKVVLVYFWSTECAVCLDQLPEMRRNLDGWRGKDFLIVAVNQDRAMSDLQAYERVLDKVAPTNAQMEIVWRHDPGYRDSFGTLPMKTPTTLIVDRQGKVVRSVTGRAAPELWDDIAELVLNCGTCR
jgi:thiol-disulfide isomerase/thioredoxin